MTPYDPDQLLSANPEICHGKVCFRDTRIPVYLVLELLESGVPAEEIAGKDYYPQLTLQHIKAALHVAAQMTRNQEYALFPA